MNFSQFVNHFIALLVICNPLSALPAVLRITRNQSLEEKRRTGMTATFAVGLILLISAWMGTALLELFGIEIPAFQVAGGLVLLAMAFSMLNAEESSIKTTTDEQKEKRTTSGAIVPLAIPIIAGPAAISSIIVSVGDHPGFIHEILISISAILVTLTIGVLLYFSSNLEKLLGQSGINIINRIGGLILASIAVQTVSSGLSNLFPGLTH
jgi:multiple antibiotic resistance protein